MVVRRAGGAMTSLADALHQLYPTAVPAVDYVIVDRGHGPFLEPWHLDEKRPTSAELAGVGYTGPYLTPQEAHMADQKVLFAQRMQAACTQLAQVADAYADMFTVYFDRGYDAAGANPIVDDDLTSLGITAANIAAGMTLAEQIQHFLNNQAALVSDYDQTLNALRTDT